MRRREALRGAAGLLPAFAHPTPTTTPPEGERTPAPDGTQPLDTLTVSGAKEAVAAPDGETAFVATTDGFATVDTADPRSLSLRTRRRDILADREGGPLEAVWDVKHDDDRLLLVGPAHARRNAISGAVVYGVSDPANPDRTGVYETAFPIHNCALDGTEGYLTANDGDGTRLVVIDVTDLAELATWSLTDHDDAWSDVDDGLRTLHDVFVRDGTAALAHWDAGTWLLDVSDPGDPSFVARVGGRDPSEMTDLSGSERARQSLEGPGNHHTAAVSPDGTLLAVGVESWNATGDDDGDSDAGPGGITLYDVSDPAAPTELSTVDPPPTDDPDRDGVWTTAHNFELTDDTLYSAWYRGGVRVFDVSAPASPVEVAAWRDDAATSFWTAQRGVAGEFFLASSWRRPGAETTTDGRATGQAAVYTFSDPIRASTTTQAGTTGRTTGPTTVDGGGFGVTAAAAGLALAGWRWLRE